MVNIGEQWWSGRPEIVKAEGFFPNPVEVLENLRELARQEGVTANAFIHGSYVYATDSFSNKGYKSDKHFDEEGRFLGEVLIPVTQPPDVDIVMAVDDMGKFNAIFDHYVGQNNLSEKLNHFFTLNVVPEEELIRNICTDSPLALKLILSFRELKVVGDEGAISEYRRMADQHRTGIDDLLQGEYDDHKKYKRVMAQGEHGIFYMDREAYERDYPTMLAGMEGEIEVGFPRERTKHVLPNVMGLKEQIIRD